MDLSIQPIPTRKDKIKHPLLSDADVIPKINTSSLFVGSSGSGKTTLVANILTRKDMLDYKKNFDRTFLISPTAHTDDIQGYLKLPEDDIIDRLDEAPALLQEIMDDQREEIKKLGADKAPKMLIYFDDVVSDPEFMKSEQFVDCFIMPRHFNLTVFISSQSYKLIPRKCRLQAKHIFYFKGAESENEAIMEDRAPPGFTQKMALRLVQYATGAPHSFLHIHMGVPIEERYRRNLDEIIHMSIANKASPEKEPNHDISHNQQATEPVPPAVNGGGGGGGAGGDPKRRKFGATSVQPAGG